ncbi:MAG: Na/Pi symporter [bacterium]
MAEPRETPPEDLQAARARRRELLLNIAKAAGIVAALYFFLVGIQGIGASFELFGSELANRILVTTNNPISGLFIGILATTLVQSSSTTTSIIVGMVAGGGISLQGAIPMVMGANIGTTVTNTIVSVGHITRVQEFKRAFAASTVHDFFNLMAVIILFPLEYFFGIISRPATVLAFTLDTAGGLKLADPLKLVVSPMVGFIEGAVGGSAWLLLIISVALTFYMLFSLVKILRSLVLSKVEAFFDTYIFKTALRGFGFGVVLTFLVQSSSITTSLMVPLVGAGVLTLVQIFPYTIGANVGTTLTANIAAFSTGNPYALSVSFAHLIFNLLGTLVIWPVPAVRRIPIRLAELMARLAVRSKLIPLFYILIVFYLIPILVIVFEGGIHA